MVNTSPLSILVGSFNVHKLRPPVNVDLSSWLTNHRFSLPDIVAVGFQEVSTILFFDGQKSEYQWKVLLESILPNYQLLDCVRLNGSKISVRISLLNIFLFIKRHTTLYLCTIDTFKSMFIDRQCSS